MSPLTLDPQSEEDRLNDHGDEIIKPQFGPDSPLKDLEDQFARPSIADSDRNTEVTRLNKNLDEPSYGTKSAEDIAEQEKVAGLNTGGFFKQNESDSSTSIPKKLFGRFNKKSSSALGVTAVFALGGFGFFSIVQGPLQLVHLSHILSKNFTNSERDANLRVGTMIRYYRTGDIGSTRVGFMGQKIFDKTIAQLKAGGIEFERNSATGHPKSATFDSSKIKDLNGLKPDQAKDLIARELGTTPDKVGRIGTGADGKSPKYGVGVRDFDQKNLRNLSNRSVDTLENGKIYSQMQKRVLRIFFNTDWSPMNKLENKLANRAERAAQAKERRQQTRSPIQQKIDTAKAKVKDKVSTGNGAKLGAGALTGTAALCIVRDLSQIVPDYQYNVRTAASVDATAFVNIGSQVEAMNGDFDLGQIGGEVESLKNIWGSQPLQATIDPENAKGQDIDPDRKKAFSGESSWGEINSFVNGVPAVDTVCSTGGQIAAGALGLALLSLGPGGWALKSAQTIVGASAGIAVLNLAQSMISPNKDLIPDEISNPEGGSWLAYGMRAASDSAARGEGGIQLSDSETVAIDRETEEAEANEFNNKNLFAKMFDPTDYRSVAGTAVRSIDTSPQGTIQSIASLITKPWKIFSSLSTIFMPHASAQSNTYKWPTNRFGIPQEILDNEETYGDYKENANKAAASVLNNDELKDRVKKCFGAELDPGNGGWKKIQDVDIFGKDYMSSNCNEKSETWYRIMLFIFDDNLLAAAGCYEGIADDACPDVLGNSSGGADPSTSLESEDFDVGDLKIRKLKNPMPAAGGTITPKGVTLHWWAVQSGNGIQPLVSGLRGNTTCGAQGCSVQLGITSDGDVWQLTKNLEDRTLHAIGANDTTIGIEIEGGPAEFGKDGIEKYPKKFEAVVKTVQYLKDKYNIPLNAPPGCGQDAKGIHPHKAYNICGNSKSDIDDYYYKEVMKRIK